MREGNAYGFTDENVTGDKSETFNREMYAQMASRVLTSPEYVDKLVRADRTLAEKIKNRISDVIETLRSVTSKDIEIRKQLRRATKAQGLFERALGAGAGNSHGVAASFALRDIKIPTRNELESKPPVRIVDISTPKTIGRFAERRKQILEDAKEVIKKPYLNRDTNTMIFITNRSYTHTFNNIGKSQLNAMEHLPELIENAILTHGELPTHGDTHADGVYTFFAAVRDGKEIKPVKLKVKEYNYNGQDLPQNITEYFAGNPTDYAAAYDSVVLTVEEMEESPAGSAKDVNTDDSFLGPEELSDISIADLLAKVKGKAEEYIPKSDFSLENVNESHENVNEEANQQTSGDFGGVLKEAGILESGT